MSQVSAGFGPLLREWRQRRRISQLDLALQSNVSARHVSFLETGRSQPSRDMVLHLADELDIPLRERNLLLTAAGYAPVFRERTLADPAFGAIRRAVEQVIQGHTPFPALAIDRHWTLVTANDAALRLMGDVEPTLLQPPVNVLRVALHPCGLAPRTANLPEWRAHLLDRLRRQTEATADPVLIALLAELRDYPQARSSPRPKARQEHSGAVVPFELVTHAGVMSFISTTTVFGTPVDITLAELALECFYPSDATTIALLRQEAETRSEHLLNDPGIETHSNRLRHALARG